MALLIPNGRRNPLTTHVHAGIAALPGIKTKAEFEASYEWCQGFLSGEPERNIASNVNIVRVNETMIGVRLYDTIIVQFYSDGTFSVDNGGYNTLTTAYRIDQFTPKTWRFWHANKRLDGAKNWDWANAKINLTHEDKLTA